MADKPDYRAILTQLYLRYNPEKVRDVEFLLKKFEGREEEMIDKIQRKYAHLSATTTPPPPAAESDPGEILAIPEEVSAPPAEKPKVETPKEKPPVREKPKTRTLEEPKSSRKPEGFHNARTPAEGVATTPVREKEKPKPPIREKTKPQAREKPKPPANPTSEKPKKGRRILGFGLIGLLLAAGGFAAWYFWGGETPLAKKQFLYVVADTVYSHDQCSQSMESRLTPFAYGKAIEVQGLEGTCVTTKVDGKKEFIPKKFLGSAREWQEIDAIYGNEPSRELFDNSYEKRALRNYFNRTQIMGYIPQEKQKELYGKPRTREVWQVYGLTEESEFSPVAKGRFSWGNAFETEETNRPDDLAVIISEMENRDRRKLLLFNFDEEKVDNFVDEMDLSNYPGFQIRPCLYKEEIFLFGTPYLRLDASLDEEEEEDPEESEIRLALLMQKPGLEDRRYLIEVVQGELQLFSLEKGFFKMFKKDRVFQP